MDIKRDLNQLAAAISDAVIEVTSSLTDSTETDPQVLLNFYRDKFRQIAQATDEALTIVDITQTGYEALQEDRDGG